MLLSDEERRALWLCSLKETQGPLPIEDFARDIEAAILAKLASAELPEPAIFQYDAMLASPIKAYTADQLRQAYAQGAAAQLSSEPIGEFEALPDPTVGELAWLNIYDAKSRVAGTKLYTRREAND